MSLHNGIDTVAIITLGVFTKTYGAAAPGNIANLYASFGYFEDAPTQTIIARVKGWMQFAFGCSF